jgi:hypothetical protein
MKWCNVGTLAIIIAAIIILALFLTISIQHRTHSDYQQNVDGFDDIAIGMTLREVLELHPEVLYINSDRCGATMIYSDRIIYIQNTRVIAVEKR